MDRQIPTSGKPASEPTLALVPAAPVWPVGQLSDRFHRLGVELRQSCRAHALFIALVLVYGGVGALVPPLFGATPRTVDIFFSAQFLRGNVGVLGVLTLGYLVWIMAVVRPPHIARYLHKQLTSRFLTAERIAAALPVLLLYPVFISASTGLKAVIPAIQPFAWDAQFAAWDSFLHGGRQPWEWLQPLFGRPYATDVIDQLYLGWFYVGGIMLFWQMLSLRRPRLRMQFFLSIVLIWILLGNVAAIVLSSAGPCYYGRVTGLPDPFAPLIDYLQGADDVVFLWALLVQEELWKTYLDPSAGVLHGISAMPSLHVTAAFCYTLLGFAVSRRLGLALGLFTVAILIGSVHLGWHYAIDGYAGMLGAYVIWRTVGWFLARPTIAKLLWGDRTTDLG
jgi:PAP2 superfamily